MKIILLGLILVFSNTTLAESFFEKNQKACNLKNKNACYNLGVIYYAGKNIKKDYIKSADFYEKACALGHKNGCYNLVNMYHNEDKTKIK